jgi:hypothetical protein
VTEIIRSLEVRVASADIPALLLRTLPALATQHYIDYRIANEKLGSSYALGGGASLHHIFHSTQSHIAIDAEGQIDPEYFRRVFDHILAKTLPSQDNESEAERTIIREIIVKVLLQDVTPLLIQPWFIHRLLLDRLNDGLNVPPSAKVSLMMVHSCMWELTHYIIYSRPSWVRQPPGRRDYRHSSSRFSLQSNIYPD